MRISRRGFLKNALAGMGTLGVSFRTRGNASRERPLYRSDYRIIDIHGHGLPYLDAFKTHRESMDRTGVDVFTILLFDAAGWHYTGGWSESNLQAWARVKQKFPESLVICGSADFDRAAKEPNFFARLPSEVEGQARLGAQGIKIWKNLGLHHRDESGALLKINDERLDPFWKKCGELKLPIWIHAADPKEYWEPSFKLTKPQLHRPGTPSWEELIRQRNAVLEKHPGTTFIGCHFGSYSSDLKGLGAALEKYPNFQVECSARLRYLATIKAGEVREFYVRYQDRLLFGTDLFLPNTAIMQNREKRHEWIETRARIYSWCLEYFETDHNDLPLPPAPGEQVSLNGIGLPAGVLKKFYFDNAARMIPDLGAR